MRKKVYGDVSIVSIGSSLKFCIVAEGKADFAPRLSTMEWDTTAGQIICEEAGFQVIDDKTKSITYNRKNLKNNFFTVKQDSSDMSKYMFRIANYSDFIIAGVMKSGTTFLHNSLNNVQKIFFKKKPPFLTIVI